MTRIRLQTSGTKARYVFLLRGSFSINTVLGHRPFIPKLDVFENVPTLWGRQRTNKMKDERELAKRYKEIKEDYAFDPSIFNNDPERIRAVKEIINNKLCDVDKIIILLYVDCQSYRKLGKRMNLSHMTVRQEVLRIKGIIFEELKKYDLR